MSNTVNIPSFPAFFKDKQDDRYMALLSGQEILYISMFETTDVVRRDSYAISIVPDQDVMRSFKPVSEEEFRTALRKAQEKQMEWYEEKLTIQTTNIPNIITGS